MSRRRSWIDSANDPASDFPLENLPFGVIERDDASDRRIAVAIGDQVEMTFRRMFTADGLHNYFWKARPVGG